MNPIFQKFISVHGTQFSVIFFAGIFFITWNLENVIGIFIDYKKWRHAFLNAPFIFTNIPGQLLMGWIFAKVILWTGMHHFGFLYLLPLQHSPLLLFVITFTFLDFGEYLYHVIMHKVSRLWMFHLVHHSDPIMDVSTTLREHPGENLIRLSFTLVWVLLSGATIWVLILRQIIQTFFTTFSHMNYRLPSKTDAVIGSIFVTPNLHRVHHHYQQPFTDSNYGDVLSIWDRLFGTLSRLPEEDLVFGVDTHMSASENGNFKSLLKMPFGKYRRKK
ncbi:MAG: sterol desaturase family protein [Bacteroidota bacterium]|nr:sterol desaturase family protein [Bacteroidota bacterium]